MKYQELKKRASISTSNLIAFKNYSFDYEKELNKILIKNIEVCFKKDIPIEINEKEYVEVMRIYLSIKKEGLDEFMNNLAKLSPLELDYLKILDLMKEG